MCYINHAANFKQIQDKLIPMILLTIFIHTLCWYLTSKSIKYFYILQIYKIFSMLKFLLAHEKPCLNAYWITEYFDSFTVKILLYFYKCFFFNFSFESLCKNFINQVFSNLHHFNCIHQPFFIDRSHQNCRYWFSISYFC